MEAKSRSPNYPRVNLAEAIEATRPVYAKEKRARFPRLSLVKHLGYSSLNGRSLGKIGALRAYGLIDGREDQLFVSQTAIALIDAPEGSAVKAQALKDAFMSPPLFRRIHEEHGDDLPSEDTLRWWLVQQDYVGDAAAKAAEVYLASLELVTQAEAELNASSKGPSHETPSSLTTAATALPHIQHAYSTAPSAPPFGEPDFKGSLGNGVEYALQLRGQWGPRDLAKLVRVLKLQEELMREADDTASDRSSDTQD